MNWRDRYEAAVREVRSAIAALVKSPGGYPVVTSPQRAALLLVQTQVDVDALANLLILKGAITATDWDEARAIAMEAERAVFARAVADRAGRT